MFKKTFGLTRAKSFTTLVVAIVVRYVVLIGPRRERVSRKEKETTPQEGFRHTSGAHMGSRVWPLSMSPKDTFSRKIDQTRSVSRITFGEVSNSV